MITSLFSTQLRTYRHLQPLDYFEETVEHGVYKTLKVFLIFVAMVLYILVPTIIVLIESPLSFDAFIIILIGIVPFTILNLFCSTLVYAMLKAFFWFLSKIANAFQLSLVAKLFKMLRSKLDIIAISILLSLIFLVYYLQGGVL